MGVALREQIRQAAVSVSTIGDSASNNIVPGVAGKINTIVALVLVSNVAGTSIIIKDGVGGTALSGAMLLSAGVPLVLNPDPTVDWYQSLVAGNPITLNLSAGTQVSGTVWFVQN